MRIGSQGLRYSAVKLLYGRGTPPAQIPPEAVAVLQLANKVEFGWTRCWLDSCWRPHPSSASPPSGGFLDWRCRRHPAKVVGELTLKSEGPVLVAR